MQITLRWNNLLFKKVEIIAACFELKNNFANILLQSKNYQNYIKNDCGIYALDFFENKLPTTDEAMMARTASIPATVNA